MNENENDAVQKSIENRDLKNDATNRPMTVVSMTPKREDHPDFTKLRLFNRHYDQHTGAFKVGDYVKRVPNTYVGKFPKEGQPVLVVEVFEPRRRESFELGQIASTEYYDFTYAVVDSDGEILIYTGNSKTFMPWETKV